MYMQPAADRSMDALGRDVSFLGRVLGDVLREQGGDELFDAVEGLRRACRHMRHHNCDMALDEVRERVGSLPLPLARQVARAFTIYFHLINMAEENHRLRRIDQREEADWPAPRYDSIGEVIHTLREAGAPEDEVRDLLRSLAIRPVFTAHPTEARRMTLLRYLRRISDLVEALQDENVPPRRRGRLIEDLYAEVTGLWQTNELRLRQQTVMDEVSNGLWYFDQSVFDVTAQVYRDLREALAQTYPPLADETFDILTFGSWIGGDRDGNPNVTADVTEKTLRAHKQLVLKKYAEQLVRLGDELTTSTALLEVTPVLRDDIENVNLAGEGGDEARGDEPYRRRLLQIITRVRATWEGSPDGYPEPKELLNDLRSMSESLRGNRGARLAGGKLADLIQQVGVFGFHLARLDIRQHRDGHLHALDELLGEIEDGHRYGGLSDERKCAVLEQIMRGGSTRPSIGQIGRWLQGRAAGVPPSDLSESTMETLLTFRAIRRAQQEMGPEAVNTYIVSMAQDAADILAVLFFAWLAGLFDPAEPRSTLRAVPLFETEADLTAAPEIMRRLWTLDLYRSQLAAWNRAQEIMIGYSDSDKDAGYTTSNWLLYRAQQELTACADDLGVAVTFFHGRGGAIGRGGGPLARAILGQPAGTVRGRVKVTEQGEVLFTRYGNPGIAHRHLEQMVNAVIRASSRLSVTSADIERWEQTTAGLSVHAARTYRALIDDENFFTFFEEGTPLRSIVRLRIASRPASRRQGRLKLSDLRAIPWVFGWTQARYGLPGWYGLGSALDASIRAGDLDELRVMYSHWPFFRWLLDAAQISLGKADFTIASEYAGLVLDQTVRERYSALLRQEYERTCSSLNLVLDQTRLLDSWPVLQRSIELRNPYVDPMSFIQVRAIHDVRQASDDAEAELLRSIIDRSVTGIAAGLQNTG